MELQANLLTLQLERAAAITEAHVLEIAAEDMFGELYSRNCSCTKPVHHMPVLVGEQPK